MVLQVARGSANGSGDNAVIDELRSQTEIAPMLRKGDFLFLLCSNLHTNLHHGKTIPKFTCIAALVSRTLARPWHACDFISGLIHELLNKNKSLVKQIAYSPTASELYTRNRATMPSVVTLA
eukprot:5626373-Amphidinium_carterae.1